MTFEATLRRALDPLRARLRARELRDVAHALRRQARGAEPHGLPAALALLDQADAAAHGLPAAPRGDDVGDIDDEHRARRRARADGTRELCLCAAGALAAEGFAAAGVDGSPPPAGSAPERAVPSRLIAHALDPRAPWTVRAVALEAAARVLRSMTFAPDRAVAAQLQALAANPAQPRWVQVAAVRALGVVEPARARATARARLSAPPPGRDDALVRARLVALLAGELRDPTVTLTLAIAAEDPSEHVRQTAVRAAAGTASSATSARLATPDAEASPRVRAVAAQALAARAAGAAGDALRLPAARALARVLTDDPDPLPRRVACDVAAQVCAQADADPAVVATLAAALRDGHGTASPIAQASERARAVAAPAVGAAALWPALFGGPLPDLAGGTDGHTAVLSALIAAAGAYLAVRSLLARAEIRACRRAIPLVLGARGAHDDGDVERLEAALFHALGYEVVAKRAGGDAALLVGVPGRPLAEVPLDRPSEAATVWARRDLLRMADRRRPHVLVWAGLSAETGPGEGLGGTRPAAPPAYAADLLPLDLLSRFPNARPPRGVAPVLALAAELGIDEDVALAEMADHLGATDAARAPARLQKAER